MPRLSESVLEANGTAIRWSTYRKQLSSGQPRGASSRRQLAAEVALIGGTHQAVSQGDQIILESGAISD